MTELLRIENLEKYFPVRKVVKDNYFNFRGRGRRAEFWWFALISTIFSLITVASGFKVIYIIFHLAIFFPSITISIRRLHDTGKTGWLLALLIIPVIGWIVILVFLCSDSTPGENRYGPKPEGYSGLLRRIKAHVKAVDGVSFSISEKETLGLVGESGCGKTTIGRTILKLLEPTDGLIEYRQEDITQLNSNQMRPLRRKLQIIFQDPYASLNPRMTVGKIIREGLDIHNIGEKKERDAMVAEVLERVGLPRNILDRYPHEFSGGQRQRVGIARALILNPEFIVCDEAISALDVSIQAQIINLLADLKEEFGIAYLFIAHDLSVVEHISDRVAVMYLGKIVELAKTSELFSNPLHPYTKALLSSVPKPDPTLKHERIVLQGDVPSPIAPPEGCSFHPRCPLAVKGLCDTTEPLTVDSKGHQFTCHVVEEEIYGPPAVQA